MGVLMPMVRPMVPPTPAKDALTAKSLTSTPVSALKPMLDLNSCPVGSFASALTRSMPKSTLPLSPLSPKPTPLSNFACIT